jgi:5-hydroxyisourate hydrolase
MPGISLHAIDVTRAVPATGMRVELWRADNADDTLVVDTTIDATGNLSDAVETAPKGLYRAVFHIGDYYRGQNIELPEPAFLERAPFGFGIADAAQHYHLPLKFTPWGFSLFRGGA